MAILIDRQMPKGCWECPFAAGKHYECILTGKSYNWGLTTRPSDCSLQEIVTCKECVNCYEDKLFGGFYCNGKRVDNFYGCSKGRRRDEHRCMDALEQLLKELSE